MNLKANHKPKATAHGETSPNDRIQGLFSFLLKPENLKIRFGKIVSCTCTNVF